MALLWNWYWADNVTEAEKDKATGLHKRLLGELHDVFALKQIKKRAERGYDTDKVYVQLKTHIDALQAVHDKVSCDGQHIVYPSEMVKSELYTALRNYLDCLVNNKEYLDSMPQLRLLTADNLLTFVDREGFSYPWHYWFLYHRDLAKDVTNKKQALYEIEHGTTAALFSDDDYDSSSSGDEFYSC